MAVGLDLPFSQASGRILFIFSSLLLLLVVVQEFASGNKNKAISSTSAALSSTTSALSSIGALQNWTLTSASGNMSGPTKLSFQEATAQRRSVYTLTNSSTIPDKTIVELVEQCLNTVPSAFNTQSTRITVLLKDHHEKLWDIAGKTLLNKIGEERYNKGTKGKVEGFRGAYGSILFWDDPDFVDGLAKTGGDLHGPKAVEWTHQSNGMHQYFLWTAIESYEGMGCNLQHYNPLIDDEVKKTWSLPENLVLKAQLVFGKKKAETSIGERNQRLPASERYSAHGVEA